MVSVPTASTPGATLSVVVPSAANVCVAELKESLFRKIVPVGVPPEPVTVTVTAVPCSVEKLVGLAVTVTVAAAIPVAVHAFTTLATFIDPRPVALSNPAVASNPLSTPIVFPLAATEQLVEPAAHGIVIVPVSMSLK
jgi:hypothetical protein